MKEDGDKEEEKVLDKKFYDELFDKWNNELEEWISKFKGDLKKIHKLFDKQKIWGHLDVSAALKIVSNNII